MVQQVIANPQVTVNGDVVSIVPNSFSFTDGFGEQKITVQSAGGSSVEQVLSDDVMDNLSDIKFSMYSTQDNITIIRSWKQSPGANVLTASGQGGSGTLTRSFANASLINNYEVPLGADVQIDLEWKSDQAK